MSRRFVGSVQPAPQSAQLSLPPPIVIHTTAQLDTLLPQLLAAEAVAVDTPAHSLFSYFPKGCLFQLSVRPTQGLQWAENRLFIH